MTFDRKRAGGAALAVLVQGLFALALLLGLDVQVTPLVERAMVAVAVPPPPPPASPRVERPRRAAARAPAPPAAKAEPVAMVVPPPVIVPPPPSLPAATVGGTGDDAAAGAAAAGDGQGAGGDGDGLGARGDGEGGTPPVRIAGRITGRDYPEAAYRAGASGTVRVAHDVTADGRVTWCRVLQSSGNADLDAGTCALVVKRFRYRPALDAAGRPVATEMEGDHEWGTGRAPRP